MQQKNQSDLGMIPTGIIPPSKKIITICKHPNVGQLPIFLNFAHRQLEKGNPDPIGIKNGVEVYSLPVDIFRLVLPADRLGLIEDITELYVLYEEGK